MTMHIVPLSILLIDKDASADPELAQDIFDFDLKRKRLEMIGCSAGSSLLLSPSLLLSISKSH